MEEEAFLRAIAAAAGDDLPRLVYADWLDERGDPRAAFLRAEVIFARGRASAARRARLLDCRAELDPGWWPRVARSAGGLVAFQCAACRVPLTGPLWRLADPVWLSEADGTPLVPAGYCWESDGTAGAGTGHYCVNLADVRNVRPHPDPRRRNGCCGMDGCDGVNTVCGGGHPVGTECSDCWMAHFLHFDPPAIETIEVAAVEPILASDPRRDDDGRR